MHHAHHDGWTPAAAGDAFSSPHTWPTRREYTQSISSNASSAPSTSSSLIPLSSWSSLRSPVASTIPLHAQAHGASTTASISPHESNEQHHLTHNDPQWRRHRAAQLSLDRLHRLHDHPTPSQHQWAREDAQLESRYPQQSQLPYLAITAPDDQDMEYEGQQHEGQEEDDRELQGDDDQEDDEADSHHVADELRHKQRDRDHAQFLSSASASSSSPSSSSSSFAFPSSPPMMLQQRGPHAAFNFNVGSRSYQPGYQQAYQRELAFTQMRTPAPDADVGSPLITRTSSLATTRSSSESGNYPHSMGSSSPLTSSPGLLSSSSSSSSPSFLSSSTPDSVAQSLLILEKMVLDFRTRYGLEDSLDSSDSAMASPTLPSTVASSSFTSASNSATASSSSTKSINLQRSPVEDAQAIEAALECAKTLYSAISSTLEFFMQQEDQPHAIESRPRSESSFSDGSSTVPKTASPSSLHAAAAATAPKPMQSSSHVLPSSSSSNSPPFSFASSSSSPTPLFSSSSSPLSHASSSQTSATFTPLLSATPLSDLVLPEPNHQSRHSSAPANSLIERDQLCLIQYEKQLALASASPAEAAFSASAHHHSTMPLSSISAPPDIPSSSAAGPPFAASVPLSAPTSSSTKQEQLALFMARLQSVSSEHGNGIVRAVGRSTSSLEALASHPHWLPSTAAAASRLHSFPSASLRPTNAAPFHQSPSYLSRSSSILNASAGASIPASAVNLFSIPQQRRSSLSSASADQRHLNYSNGDASSVSPLGSTSFSSSSSFSPSLASFSESAAFHSPYFNPHKPSFSSATSASSYLASLAALPASSSSSLLSSTHVERAPPKRRRRSEELSLKERWNCPYPSCWRFYRRSSTSSIKQHLLSCPCRGTGQVQLRSPPVGTGSSSSESTTRTLRDPSPGSSSVSDSELTRTLPSTFSSATSSSSSPSPNPSFRSETSSHS